MKPQTEIVPVQLGDDVTAHVEAMALGGEEDVAFELLSFDDIAKTIESISQAILKPIRKVKPQKATVEFGLAVGLESGKLTTLLVKGTGTANLKITLEWAEKPPD